MPTSDHMNRRAFVTRGLSAVAAIGLAGPLRARAQSVVSEYALAAVEADVDLGAGQRWQTWTYGGQVPGPLVRATQGERIRVVLDNRLSSASTTIHWHGVPLPNAMDGVPGLTQDAVPPGGTFVYEFDAVAPGTYLYHSHVGLQLDRGLVGALVIDPAEPERLADREVVLVLDDWLPGAPEAAFAAMSASGVSPGMTRPLGMGGGMSGMPGMGMPGAGGIPGSGGMPGGVTPGGGMAGGISMTEPPYAGYLVNGRLGSAAEPMPVTRGERVRIRLVNACAATTMRVGITGHRLRVTHSDGQPVQPVEVDTLVLGMGERYDVVVHMQGSGIQTLLAGSVDAAVPGIVVPVLYDGAPPAVLPIPTWTPELLGGRALAYGDLRPLNPLPASTAPARPIPLVLSAGPAGAWLINGQAYPNADPLRLALGERVRLQFRNMSPLRHPMHLHGHFFQLVDPATDTATGAVKDTVLVDAMMGAVDIEFTANNLGRWLLHCHHAYHMEAGMARVVEVA